MRYLHNSDYGVSIQDAQLAQIVQNDQRKLLRAEKIAQEEIAFYLTQRWDTSYEFTNTGAWSYGLTYSPHDRVIIDYADFIANHTYNRGDCVIYNGEGWCLTGSEFYENSEFVSSSWTSLGKQYTYYYVGYPAPLFNYLNNYNIGDKVWWKGWTYNCEIGTQFLSDTQALQYQTVSNLPYKNVFPDNQYANNNQQYWSINATWSMPAGTFPSDSRWIEDDNRCQQIVQWYMDMVIYHLHKTIAPKNIPENRIISYKSACSALKTVAEGDSVLAALLRQPSKGNMIVWGSDIPTNFTAW